MDPARPPRRTSAASGCPSPRSPTCADGSLDWNEIDVLHAIGGAMNQPPVVVSAALVKAVSSGAKVVLDTEVAR